jgi:hypothetical protein
MISDLKKKQYLYYAHKCLNIGKYQVSLSERELFSIIDKEVSRVSFSTEFADLLKSLFGGAIIRHKKDGDKNSTVLKRRINCLEVKKNKFYDLFLEDDYFNRDDLKKIDGVRPDNTFTEIPS